MTALIRPFSVPGSTAAFKAVRAEGSSVFDARGRRFISMASGLWNVGLGWSDVRLVDAIADQARRMAYASLFDEGHSPADLLAERLVELSGGAMAFAYLSTTGSSSVEVAIRTAILHHRVRGADARRRILSYDLGYHGCSWGTYSASGIIRAETERWQPPSDDSILMPSPRDEETAFAAVERVLATQRDEIACMVVEPVLGSAGVLVPSASYGQRLSALCRKHDVLLVADEVATGGGRCGVMFASTAVGLEPDAICLSKGLAGGYLPVAATLMSERFVAPLPVAQVAMPLGSTQDGNPIACSAAMAALDIIASDDLLARATVIGAVVRRRIADAGLTIVGEVRGLGAMIGIDLVAPDGSRYKESEAAEVRAECLEEGLLVQHFDGGISLFPPLNMADDDRDDAIDMLCEVLGRRS